MDIGQPPVDDRGPIVDADLLPLCVDQLVVQPFNIAGYIKFTGMLEGRDKSLQGVPDIWMHSLVFWIPIQLLNFRVVPTRGRVGVVFVSLAVWQTYMSVQNHARDYPRTSM